MSQVSSDDVYQMTAYAVRYGARLVTLVYPTARNSGSVGRYASVRLSVPGSPELQVCEVDIDQLTRGALLPKALLPTSDLGGDKSFGGPWPIVDAVPAE